MAKETRLTRAEAKHFAEVSVCLNSPEWKIGIDHAFDHAEEAKERVNKMATNYLVIIKNVHDSEEKEGLLVVTDARDANDALETADQECHAVLDDDYRTTGTWFTEDEAVQALKGSFRCGQCHKVFPREREGGQLEDGTGLCFRCSDAIRPEWDQDIT